MRPEVSTAPARATIRPAVHLPEQSVARGAGRLPARRIVVGVDGTAAGEVALTWAVREAWRRAALLTVVRVYAAEPGWQQSTAAAIGDLQVQLRDAVRRALSGGPEAQPVEARVMEGDPKARLVELSAGAQLLVLGRSRSGRRGSPLQRYCLLRAHCPVIVVAEEWARVYTDV